MKKFTLIAIIFSFLSFVLISCTDETKIKEEADAIFEQLVLPTEAEKGDNLGLPTAVGKATIKYEFNYSGYFDDQLNIINDSTSPLDIVMTIKITIDGITNQYTHTFRLLSNIDRYFATIEEYVRSYIPNQTRSNLNLKTSYYSTPDVTITYFSSNPEIVSHDGKYIDHRYDQEVTITCIINARNKSHTFDITFISLGLPDSKKILEVKEWLNQYISELTFVQGTILPTEHPLFKGRLRWLCNDPLVLFDAPRVVLPETAGEYTLYCELLYGINMEIVSFRVNLPGSLMTEEERVTDFITNMLPDQVNEFVVLYDGRTVDVNKSLLLDPSTVNYTLSSGKHPSVSTQKLESLFYPGYQMPNPDNVLWIVVHETGNVNTGKDALVHANLQYNNAMTGYERNASWNYQIDEGIVYQSYEDHITTWHASDGTKTEAGGNNNGIGIEMCVNCDARYDATLRHNARLIASLLLKHNLDIANIKQHYDFAPDNKNCPEQMRKTFRWFEFLQLISKEYFSQKFLNNYFISYEFNNTQLLYYKVDGIYQIGDLNDNDKLSVTAFINGQQYQLETTYRKK